MAVRVLVALEAFLHVVQLRVAVFAKALGGAVGARAAAANEQNRALAAAIAVRTQGGIDRGREPGVLLPVGIVFPGDVQRADRVSDVVELDATAHIDETRVRLTFQQLVRRQWIDALYRRRQNVLPFNPASPV